MNVVAFDLLPSLKGQLQTVGNLIGRRDKLASDIDKASAAADRLRQRVSELDADAAQAADIHIPTDAERIAQLIAGDEVQTLDRKEIDARAAKRRQIEAQRRQAVSDLDGVEAHLANLSASAARCRQELAAAQVAFYLALGKGVGDAYKAAATHLVAEFVPLLNTLGAQVAALQGGTPHWLSHLRGLTIQWYGDELIQETPHQTPHRENTVLWPRSGPTLHSGEPVRDDALVDQIVSFLRSTPDAAAQALGSGDDARRD